MVAYIPFFLDWEDETSTLTDAEMGRLVRRLLRHALGRADEAAGEGNERFVYPIYRNQINRHIDKHDKRAAACATGGRRRAVKAAIIAAAENGVTEGLATEAVAQENVANISVVSENVAMEGVGMESVAAKRGDAAIAPYDAPAGASLSPAQRMPKPLQPSAPRRASATGFVKPTVEQVRVYCAELGTAVNPERFVAYYDSVGWRVGRTPMYDWRAAVRSWATRERGAAPSPRYGYRPETPLALQYDQRVYTEAELNARFTDLSQFEDEAA